MDGLVAFGNSADDFPGGVGAAVIHQNDFMAQSHAFNDPFDPGTEFRKGFCFVKKRDNDGNVGIKAVHTAGVLLT